VNAELTAGFFRDGGAVRMLAERALEGSLEFTGASRYPLFAGGAAAA